MARHRAIARFWTRPDGATCLLHKRDDGWWLIVEKDGVPVRELAVPTPKEAIQAAKEWRDQEDVQFP